MTGYDPYAHRIREDPYPWYGLLRRECPVHHHALESAEMERINANPLVARPTREFWSVFRYDDCVDVLCAPDRFSSAEGPGPERLVALDAVGMLIYADEPHHTRQRRIVGKAFSPRMIEIVTPRIQAIADRLVDVFAARGAADLVPDFANALPLEVICEVLGVPSEDRAEFRRWTDDTIAAFGGDPESYERSFQSLQEFAGYLMAEVERRRAVTGRGDELPDDVLTSLILSPYDERQFNDVELITAVQILLVAGSDTTAAAIANAVHLLCTHPGERARLEGDWSLLDATRRGGPAVREPGPGPVPDRDP